MSISIQQNASNIENKRKENLAKDLISFKKMISTIARVLELSIFRSITNFEGKTYEFRD